MICVRTYFLDLRGRLHRRRGAGPAVSPHFDVLYLPACPAPKIPRGAESPGLPVVHRGMNAWYLLLLAAAVSNASGL